MNDELNEMDEVDMAMALSLSSETLSSGFRDGNHGDDGVSKCPEDEEEALALALSLSQVEPTTGEDYSYLGNEHSSGSSSDGGRNDNGDVDDDLASALALSAACARASNISTQESMREDDREGVYFEVWEEFENDDAAMASWDFDTRNWTWQEWDPTSPTTACEFDGSLEAQIGVPLSDVTTTVEGKNGLVLDAIEGSTSVGARSLGHGTLDSSGTPFSNDFQAATPHEAASGEKAKRRARAGTGPATTTAGATAGAGPTAAAAETRASHGDCFDVALAELLQLHGLLGKLRRRIKYQKCNISLSCCDSTLLFSFCHILFPVFARFIDNTMQMPLARCWRPKKLTSRPLSNSLNRICMRYLQAHRNLNHFCGLRTPNQHFWSWQNP